MKEQYVPTKDLKTGAKVLGVVSKEIFKSVEPGLKVYTGKRFQSFAKNFRKGSI